MRASDRGPLAGQRRRRVGGQQQRRRQRWERSALGHASWNSAGVLAAWLSCWWCTCRAVRQGCERGLKRLRRRDAHVALLFQRCKFGIDRHKRAGLGVGWRIRLLAFFKRGMGRDRGGQGRAGHGVFPRLLQLPPPPPPQQQQLLHTYRVNQGAAAFKSSHSNQSTDTHVTKYATGTVYRFNNSTQHRHPFQPS